MTRHSVELNTHSMSLIALCSGFVLGCSLSALIILKTFPFESQNTETNTNNGKYRKSVIFQETKSSEESKNDSHDGIKRAKHSMKSYLPPEIRAEQLSRHQLYFGDEGMKSLRHARVCIVGLGGVGSHAAHMLARSGIGMMRLIDFDQVTVSSLNRHAVASLRDVGIPKVTCMENFIRNHICSDPNHLVIESFVEMYTEDSGERLLRLDGTNATYNFESGWSMVIDCIDDVPTKAALLKHCLDRNIRVLSCMGAGGKADFTRLHWSDLRTAAKDPLASKLRQTMKYLFAKNCDRVTTSVSRAKNGKNDEDYLDNMDRLSVLYSSEKTVVKLADFTDEQKKRCGEEDFHQYGAVDGMRVRVVPVLGTIPAIFGQSLATICLTVIGGKEIQPVTGERIGRNTRNRIYQHLKSREQKIWKQLSDPLQATATTEFDLDNYGGKSVNGFYISQTLQVDQDDVEYLLEVWRNRCAVTGDRLGIVLELTRWDLSKPTICSNLVLVSSNVIDTFDVDRIESTKATMDKAIRSRIESRLCSCRVDL